MSKTAKQTSPQEPDPRRVAAAPARITPATGADRDLARTSRGSLTRSLACSRTTGAASRCSTPSGKRCSCTACGHWGNKPEQQPARCLPRRRSVDPRKRRQPPRAGDCDHQLTRFYRAEDARAAIGVSLSIGRRIVADHGGHLSATSPGPGRGATIVRTLPLTAASADDGGGFPRDSPQSPTRSRPPHVRWPRDRKRANRDPESNDGSALCRRPSAGTVFGLGNAP